MSEAGALLEFTPLPVPQVGTDFAPPCLTPTRYMVMILPDATAAGHGFALWVKPYLP